MASIFKKVFFSSGSNLNSFIKSVPDFFAFLVDHDRKNQASCSWDALALISMIGRLIIAIDGTEPESEVVGLQVHLTTIHAYLTESGIPLPTDDEVDEESSSGDTEDEGERRSGSKSQISLVLEDKALDELLFELSALVGLHEVKAEVSGLVNLLKIKQLREDRGLPSVSMSHHLVFTGNPGTGKTIVARLLAKIYRALGLLESGHLVEVDRSGLVAGYLGQTSLKVKKVVDEALGGVLFIDEAYSLATGESDSDYGQEAIDILVKEMEDHRKSFIVIVAGYPKEMESFVNANPGLRARFKKYINFPDYTPEEMFEIFSLMCKQAGYKISAQAKPYARTILKHFCERRPGGFSNARDARNLFETCVQLQANRIVGKPDATNAELSLITDLDFPTVSFSV